MQRMIAEWTRQRYIATEKKALQGGEEMSRVVLGPRTFNEIGHENLTKFVSNVCNFDFSEKIAKEWLMDYQGKEVNGEKDEGKKEGRSE